MRVWGWQSKKRYFSNHWDQYFSILGSIGAAQKQSSVRPHLGWKKNHFTHTSFSLSHKGHDWLNCCHWLKWLLQISVGNNIFSWNECLCVYIYIYYICSRHQACDITTDTFTPLLHPLSVKTHQHSQVNWHVTLNLMTDNLCLGVSTSSCDCRMIQLFSSRNGNSLKKRNMEETGVIEW